MKKWNLVLLFAALCFVLTACGSKKDNKIDVGTNQPTVTEKPDYYHVCVGNVSKLPNVKGIEYTKGNTEIKESDVEAYVKGMLKDYPNYKEDKDKTDNVIADGDTICLDYTGSLDGVNFAGGEAHGAFLTIGSKSFVGTFEEQMIGHKRGDSFTIDVKFPDSYPNNPDLAGKVTQFKIHINYIAMEEKEPTDQWINSLTSGTYATVEAYREYLREQMKAEAENQVKDKAYGEIIDYIKENSEYEIAEADVTWYYDFLYSQLTSYATMYGVSEETFVQYSGYESLDQYKAECKENAKSMAEEYTLLQAIAKQENITVSDEIYKKYIKEYMESAGAEDEEKFLEGYGKDYIEYIMLMDEVWDYLYSNGTPVEKPATEETKTEAPATEATKTEAVTEETKTEAPVTDAKTATEE